MLMEVGSLLDSFEEQVRAGAFLNGVFRSVWAVRQLYGREASMHTLQNLISCREITRHDAVAMVATLDDQANFTCGIINAPEKERSRGVSQAGGS